MPLVLCPSLLMALMPLVGSLDGGHAIDEPPPPFAEDIAAFEAADREAPPARGQVLFVGSSTIRMWDLARSFPELDALNRGFGGSTMEDLLRYTDRIVLPYRPRTIVIYEGDNDLAQGQAPEDIVERFDVFLARVTRALPRVPIYILTVKPSLARRALLPAQRELNEGLVRLCAERFPTACVVDTFTPTLDDAGEPRADLLMEDGLHLNEAGYDVWTAVLREAAGDALAPRP